MAEAVQHTLLKRYVHTMYNTHVPIQCRVHMYMYYSHDQTSSLYYMYTYTYMYLHKFPWTNRTQTGMQTFAHPTIHTHLPTHTHPPTQSYTYTHTNLSSIHPLWYHTEYCINAWCRDGVITEPTQKWFNHFILMVQLEIWDLVHRSVEHFVPRKVTAVRW